MTANATISHYDKLRGRLWPKGPRPNIWAVFDCAHDPQLWWALDKSSLVRECLYAGTITEQLERAAPYLVQLEYDEPQTIRLLNRWWGRSACVVLRSGTNLKSLRAHLRRMLLVSVPGGKRMVFRFYDPRVMRVFLPTCSTNQLEEIFGPIECIAVEEPAMKRMMEFRLDMERKTLDTVAVGLS